MKLSDLKYLMAYTIPLAAILAISLGGIWSYATVFYAFGLIPIIEFFTPNSTYNLPDSKKTEKLQSVVFDWLLYLNLPVLYVLLAYFFYTLSTNDFATWEVVGMTLSVGIVVGASGINVAHELGHRSNQWEQFIAKLLLLPAFYMHFFIEHNRGHHKYVATDEDPASARYGEDLYRFWLRSVVLSYFHAWKLEHKRLQKAGISFWSWQNEMLRFQMAQIAYLLVIGWIWGGDILFNAITTGIVGFLLLETINYIEHYGLQRKKLASGRYEVVNVQHSWNSNFEMGRIVLYELTRHSDHHHKASKKYQILDHHDKSPQLPMGYPSAMLLSLFPPLWFLIMNKRIKKMKAAVDRA